MPGFLTGHFLAWVHCMKGEDGSALSLLSCSGSLGKCMKIPVQSPDISVHLDHAPPYRPARGEHSPTTKLLKKQLPLLISTI